MGVRLTIVNDESARRFADAGFRQYDDFAHCESGVLVAESGTTRTRRIDIDAPSGRFAAYLKVYRYEGERWRHRFRRDKGAIEARNYALMQERGIAVPIVIAHGARRSGLRLLDSFILTAEIPFATPLDAHAKENWRTPRSAEQTRDRRETLECLAEFVAQMHDRGFCHIDLQWRNVLVSRPPEGPRRLHLIDSARGGIRHAPLTRAYGRLRDLSSLHKQARMYMTRAEMLRWFARYLGVAAIDDEHRAMVWSILADRAAKETEESA